MGSEFLQYLEILVGGFKFLLIRCWVDTVKPVYYIVLLIVLQVASLQKKKNAVSARKIKLKNAIVGMKNGPNCCLKMQHLI